MLTIVIPSYNHEKYVYECLSAAAQVAINDLKILVIDDGSTDKTPVVVKGFIDEHQGIDIQLVEKENAGLISSLNLALELVDTEFIYICASDDIPMADGIVSCINILIDNEYNFVVGGAKGFFNKSEEFNVYGPSQEIFLNSKPEEREKSFFYNYPSPLLIQSSVFRTDSIRNIGGWDPNLKLDDYPFFIKMLTKYSFYNKDFYYMPEVSIVKYRQHENNSYLDAYRLFEMVREVVFDLAPMSERDKIMTFVAVKYFLAAFLRHKYKDSIKILSSLSFKSKIIFPLYFFKRLVFKTK